MYKDLIYYELADGVSEDQLLKVAQKVHDQWMSKQPGFLYWKLHKHSNNIYLDIVCWESREAAKNAEKTMMEIPASLEWMSHYKEGSIRSENMEQFGQF